ncbi:hypothetical protein D3C73_1403320 [compost metagenome]
MALLPAGVRHFLPAGVILVQPEVQHIGWQIGIAWNPDVRDMLRDKFVQMVTTPPRDNSEGVNLMFASSSAIKVIAKA